MRPYKICCITYKALDDLVKETLKQHPDPELEVVIVEGLQEEVIRGLTAAEDAGYEVAIGGGANAKIAQEHSGIPVIEYRLTAYDYLDAIDRAYILGKDVAMCTYQEPMEPVLQKYLSDRGIQIANIIYETGEDLKGQLLENRDKVIIGAAHAVDLATELGLKSVSIYPGITAVLVAFRDAKTLARQMRRQRERNKFSQAVVDNSTNGLILVDSKGRVIDYNEAARELFKKPVASVKGYGVAEALPDSGLGDFLAAGDSEQTDIRRVQGDDILCKWVRLTERGRETIGAVGIFSSMPDILRAQMEYQHKQLREQRERGFSAKMRFSDIIGDSPALLHTKEEALLYARSDASVLLYGETGVGKEIFAQSIHNESARKSGPFIAINCAALPEQLLESELFGYDEGAFTGGRRGGKKGLFELAFHGTVFLDEIGELSPALQSRLLRVLQEREIMHVGGDRVIPIDVRVIAATNRSLEGLPTDKFRRDLYYRISVLELSLPPLREREGDAAQLFGHFFRQRGNLSTQMAQLPPSVFNIIDAYHWPGNIRELQNCCERFLLYVENGAEQGEKFLRRSMIRAIGEERLLASILQRYGFPGGEPDTALVKTLKEVMGYSKSQIGEKLGVSRTTLWRLEKKD